MTILQTELCISFGLCCVPFCVTCEQFKQCFCNIFLNFRECRLINICSLLFSNKLNIFIQFNEASRYSETFSEEYIKRIKAKSYNIDTFKQITVYLFLSVCLILLT